MVVCIAALILCFVISTAVSHYTAYRMGYELLMLNGMLTYCGLYGTSYENDNENENSSQKNLNKNLVISEECRNFAGGNN